LALPSAVICVRTKSESAGQKIQWLFVYDRDKGFAQELANHVDKNDSNIEGVFVAHKRSTWQKHDRQMNIAHDFHCGVQK